MEQTSEKNNRVPTKPLSPKSTGKIDTVDKFYQTCEITSPSPVKFALPTEEGSDSKEEVSPVKQQILF